MRTLDWYFDFVSPYAYFGLLRLRELGEVELRLRPVLFAGLLQHTGQKGPAEIPAKRIWTYRACTFHAMQHGIDFRLPAGHPFNPLPYLRLAIAAGLGEAAVRRIFTAIWTSGADPADPARIAALAEALQVDPARLAAPEIKDQLRASTDEAIAHGVFGVPTLRIDGELFWGADAIDFAKAVLADPALLQHEAMQACASLPVSAARR